MKQRIYLLFILFATANSVHGQVFPDVFGKNRVQYHNRFSDWRYYESDHFYTFWYGAGKNIAEQASVLAESEIYDLERLLEYRISKKIDIIVYNDLSDLHQSNLGIDGSFLSDDVHLRSLENKLFIHNTADLEDLRLQIREGIASILINYSLYGENLKEIIRNSLFSNLPNWFKPGLISFAGRQWTVKDDAKLRLFYSKNQSLHFEELQAYDPVLAGHSFWNYMVAQYGRKTIGNILYLLRINGNLGAAMKYSLSRSEEDVFSDWSEFYTSIYQSFGMKEWSNYALDISKNSREHIIRWEENSEDAIIAYVTDQKGKKRMYIKNHHNKKIIKIFKTGAVNPFLNSDRTYPLTSWIEEGQKLFILYEKRDVLYYRTWNASDKSLSAPRIFAPQVDRVLDLCSYMQGEIIVSAIQNGYSDLYYFNVNNGQLRRITRNIYLEEHIYSGSLLGRTGVFLSTNRNNPFLERNNLDSILPSAYSSAYFFDLSSKEYIPLSENNHSNSRFVRCIDSTSVLILSDQSGVNNFYISHLKPFLAYYSDSVYYKNQRVEKAEPALKNFYDTTLVDSVHRSTILSWKGNTRPISRMNRNINKVQSTDNGVLVTIDGNPNTIYQLEDLDFINTQDPLLRTPVASQRYAKENKATHSNPINIEKPKKSKNTSKKPNFFFQTPFTDPPLVDSSDIESDVGNTRKTDTMSYQTDSIRLQLDTSIMTEKHRQDSGNHYWFSHTLINPIDSNTQNRKLKTGIGFNFSKIVPYRLRFKITGLETDIENEPLITGMELFLNDRENNFVNPMGLTLRAEAKDILEDYIVEAAFRLPMTLDGSEFFVAFENRKKQLDQRYIFHRRIQNSTTIGNGRLQDKNSLINNNVFYQLRYPLSIFGSLRLTHFLRLDNYVPKALDQNSLDQNTTQEQRLGFRLSYVHDSSYDIDINIKGGMRYRFFGELQKRLSLDYVDDFSIEWQPGFNYLLGADFRYYLPILKHSVLAFRGVSAISLGSEKVLFYLGGTRNGLGQAFDNSIPLPNDQYSFYSLATNIRGFEINKRNGTSYAIANVEWRIPIVKYINRHPVKSPFWRSLQCVAFFDMGKSWEGVNPLNNSQSQSNVTIQNNEFVRLDLNFYRQQLLMGYGWGLRAQIFGYFIRLDHGQGIESGQWLSARQWHVSLGLDF